MLVQLWLFKLFILLNSLYPRLFLKKSRKRVQLWLFICIKLKYKYQLLTDIYLNRIDINSIDTSKSLHKTINLDDLCIPIEA